MTSIDLELALSDLVTDALREEFGDAAADADPVVRPSKFADFQVNGALPLAKRLARQPRDVAEAIARHLLLRSDVLASADVSGPGFINCTFTNEFLSGALAAQAADDRLGRPAAEQPATVVVDYGGPNVAKEMAVHHLRSTVIGDALVRVLTSRGDQVVKQNHLGDWGTQFGMLTQYLMEQGTRADDAEGLQVGDLDELYRAARTQFDADDDFKARARERVVDLQAGEPETIALWQMLVSESKRHFDEVFDRLGVLLTDQDYRGESMYNDMLDGVVEELDRKNLLYESEGALCTFPEGFKTQDGQPLPMIVRKSDGGYGYQATDLAAVRYAVDHDGADLILYVVDGRQAQHFAMVIASSRDAGWLDDDHNGVHVPFGMMMGKDGKPFKTRSGGNYKLVDLLNDAVAKATAAIAERWDDITEAEKANIANAVAVAAVKWADLKNDRTQNYVFDLDAMIRFEGDTGPYIQYAITRTKSVLRKAGSLPEAADFLLTERPERDLALHLNAYGSVVERVASVYEPHQLCTYLFELAGLFSTFWESCPVLNADTPELRASRLGLCSLTGRILEEGAGLLGIESLERM